ncbi:hypothetical protein [Haloquadratum walsbyi]|uniref:Uncharacterized protein n=1 Tax=Haloquadratum walsbyi J07HQW2 TaxID=1238425 RepID=U1PNS3_9EURY|nr:hypothetical protein [Haloquadratum walsbyi]ERG93911.1 MAG: hypothetical protein J07HQW2_00345 [Haloquadratum walsbyi J07HQW2]
MTGRVTLLIYASFILTPLCGLAIVQLLLRSGLFTAETTEQQVAFFPASSTFLEFKSQLHRWVVMAGFFIGWIVGIGLYIYLLDQFYFN